MSKKTVRTFQVDLEGDWSGHFKMRHLPYQERVSIISTLPGIESEGGALKHFPTLLKLAEKELVELKAKHVDGEKFDNMDDLSYFHSCSDLMNSLAAAVLNGPTVGKSLKAKSKEPQPTL